MFWTWQHWNRSNSARLLHFSNLTTWRHGNSARLLSFFKFTTSKATQFCEVSHFSGCFFTGVFLVFCWILDQPMSESADGPPSLGKTQRIATFAPLRAPAPSLFSLFLFSDLLSSAVLLSDSFHLCFSICPYWRKFDAKTSFAYHESWHGKFASRKVSTFRHFPFDYTTACWWYREGRQVNYVKLRSNFLGLLHNSLLVL